MSVPSNDLDRLAAVAYAMAWPEYSWTRNFALARPEELRDYIRMMIQTGENDAEKITSLVLGMVRQQEQINRSKARAEAAKFSLRLISS
jgi:hypothetical protein